MSRTATATRNKQAIVARRPNPRTRRGHLTPGRMLAWTYLIIFLIVTIFPFYWILRTALSNNYALIAHPASLLPVGLTLGPFERVLGLATPQQAIAQGGSGASIDFLLSARNSLIYASILTCCVVFFSLLAAYAFARLRWPGRNLVFSLFLGGLLVPPGIMTFLPNFVLMHDLGITNTFPGLILPGALYSAFGIFFLRQFMLGLSSEIEQAAHIDGLGPIGILFRMTIPMSSGPLTTISLITFIYAWNDYFWPLMIADGPGVRPLTVALGVFEQASPETAPDFAGLMAAALVAAVPMLLLFVVFGKRIVNSIGFTGIK